jgi:hypothetical protein
MSASMSAWATSCNGETAETQPMDLAALGQHKAQCTARNGRLVAVRCAAAQVGGFVTARLVTTAAVLALITGAVLMWL